MTSDILSFTGGSIFDGTVLHEGVAARFRGGAFAELVPMAKVPATDATIDLKGDILSPGFVDLQVNGGGGVMLNDDPSVATIATIAAAHRRLGTVALLPTLITDTNAKTIEAIAAVKEAIALKVPGVIGLHLEGPHLSVVRKGAHDATFIRPMQQDDLDVLLTAAANLPLLKVTVAPETVTTAQVRSLVSAGVLVSLGHTDADYETCLDYAAAGASCVTHLFNAMSQLGNRKPGLVGAALDYGRLSAGVIADGVHVHTASLRAAWAAKQGPGQLFLVTDAMAIAGTEEDRFTLNGRTVIRGEGQLRLEDGTLAGADLDLTTALSVLVQKCGISPAEALAAATTVPAELAGISGHTFRQKGLALDHTVRLKKNLSNIIA
ncbi:MAG: N-acetylglucosamine-6-phosphate deacetylase [Pseudomonadota bacterium]